jgi:hypothetical protein
MTDVFDYLGYDFVQEALLAGTLGRRGRRFSG